jgi:hypothetical protein
MAMKKWLTAPSVVSLALVVPQVALAAGGPVPPLQGSYIGVPGSPYRYAALESRAGTVVKQEERGGRTVSELRVPGRYGVPGVDYNGATTGLSADARTLILAALPDSFPPRTTRLLVLGTAPLAVRARLTFSGWSTVDAISPDGRWLYLIHYPSSDISRYEVLAYDVPAHRLLSKPVIDPRDRGEAMNGFPISRVMSADGRWAYTLYFRPSDVPFVHALDTSGRRAVCIDLPSLSNLNNASAYLRLTHGGATLQVDTGGVTHAAIDTRTLTLIASPGHSAVLPVRPTARGRSNGGQGDVPWELIVVSIATLGVVCAGSARAARSRRLPDRSRGPERATTAEQDPHRTDRAPANDEVPAA